jgi:V8-like Glu-specific endopeptidase
MSEVVAKAVPAQMPLTRAEAPSTTGAEPPAGPPQQYAGALPKDTPAGSSAKRVTNSTGAVWPGRYNANPNRQTGRLYFWEPRQRRWSHCSGTAINTANKSFVLTAGHCIYQPDPDGNARIDGNGYYFQDLRFCPGFKANRCKLGVWYYRAAATTSSWYYGVGAGRVYNYQDDVAVVLVRPNSSGYLVNAVGGQGIRFNQDVGLTRTALGYPAQDRRFPGTPWHGDDLIYCQGRDSLAQDRTKMWIACRMTGGSSGGPWLSGVNSSWLGYVNGVNSHKPYGPKYMESPYFGTAEANLFNTYKAR